LSTTPPGINAHNSSSSTGAHTPLTLQPIIEALLPPLGGLLGLSSLSSEHAENENIATKAAVSKKKDFFIVTSYFNLFSIQYSKFFAFSHKKVALFPIFSV
jgi:hypothetical protein